MTNEYVHFSAPMTATEQTPEGVKLSGYAVVWDQLSEDLGGYRARVRKGALNGFLASGADADAYLDHDSTKPLGNLSSGTLKFSADDTGLLATIGPLPDTTYAKDGLAQVKAGLKKGMSFAFPTKDAEIKWAKEGDEKVRDIFSIRKLTEVSVVTRPAFSQTSIAQTFALEASPAPAEVPAVVIEEKPKEEKKEAPSKPQNTNKQKTVNSKKETHMSLSWTEIKKSEEARNEKFAAAQELMEKNDRSDEETAQLDALCDDVEKLEKKIEADKRAYFSRSAPVSTRKNVVEMKPFGTEKSYLEQLGVKPKDVQRYSLCRAIDRLASGKQVDGLEGEISEEIAKYTGRPAQGFYMPTDLGLNDKYDLTTTTGSGGVNAQVLNSQFIELLRAKTLANTLGVRYLTNLNGTFTIPKQSGAATGYWINSEGGAPTASNQTITQVSMTPRTVGAYTDFSRRFVQQSALSAEAMVRDDLAAVLAISIDTAVFNGSGSSGEPRGILQTVGVTDFVTTGDEYKDMVHLERLVEDANALQGSLHYVMRPSVKETLKTTPKFTTGSTFVWEGTTVNGYPAHATTLLPSNYGGSYAGDTPVLFGDFSQCIIGLWGALDILVDPYTNSASGTVRVRALQEVDVVVRHAEAFAACMMA